ncbi:MAG: PQQ-binding-like beta-propeller repeat protein, partial [Dokdonella sp.]|uniref:outer membrane protein assembly factor BamB family protein n=1 Tax=Dokdonella sp. TaxID=2291710 RepID=UPI003263FABD
SAPVYLAGVATSSGTKNLLFALTRQSGTLLAIDAATGAVVWSKATGSGAQWITSAPAIDPGRLYVYSHGMDGFIHKYQVGDGTEISGGGWPQLYTNRPDSENANGSLALGTWNGTSYLYSVTSGYGESGDYQGHLTTVNLATGTQTVFNTICSNVTTHIGAGYLCDVGSSSGKSGIWGRGGATFDAARGKIYIVSGNGPYTADASTGNTMKWGDSVLSLAPDGVGATPGIPYDSYTPTDYASLDNSDSDLGSMSMALLPVPAGSSIAHVGLQGGKDDTLHVINLDDMSGGGGPRHVGGEMQILDAGGEYDGAREQPAVWLDGSGSTWVFFASFRNGVTAFKMSLGAGNVPTLTREWHVYRGSSTDTTSPVVANGVMYHVSSCPDQNSNCLVARDPATGNVLYSSAALGGLHFQSPIVVDGGVYVFDANSKLRAFGTDGTSMTFTVTPSAGANGTISPSTPQTVSEGATTAFTVTAMTDYVAHVSGCGGTLTGMTYTTAPVTANCMVSALFVGGDLIFSDGFEGP